MNLRIAIAAATFIAFISLCAFTAWCGGFDFDKRNPDVGLGVMMSTIMGVGAAAFAASFPSKGGHQ